MNLFLSTGGYEPPPPHINHIGVNNKPLTACLFTTALYQDQSREKMARRFLILAQGSLHNSTMKLTAHCKDSRDRTVMIVDSYDCGQP